MPIDVANIRRNGWLQGDAFTVGSSRNLIGEELVDDGSRLILASQDCDIVHRGSGEPSVDVFVATPIQRLSPFETKARNARRLHLNLTSNGQNIPHEIKFWSRRSLAREALAAHLPAADITLDRESRHWLSQWLSKRYDRPAFPDRFAERLERRDARRVLRNILNTYEHCFRDIYLAIDPDDEELPEQTPYAVRIQLVMFSADASDALLVATAEHGRRQLEAFMRDIVGVHVDLVEVITDTEFTLADLDTYHRWDFSDLTPANDEGI
jgi:hypothetical protein